MIRVLRVFVVLALAAAAYAGVWLALHHVIPFRLELVVEQTQPAEVQVFWDVGSGYSEPESSRSALLTPGSHGLQFEIPANASALRLDPRSGAGTIRIHAMRIRHLLAVSWDRSRGFSGWQADNDISGFAVLDGVLEVEADGPDPYLSNPNAWAAIQRTLRIEKGIAATALGLLALWICWPFFRPGRQSTGTVERKSLLPRLALLFCSVVVFGAAGYVIAWLLKERPAQYTPARAYELCFLSRDGKRLSPREGSLALVLDPFTFYANYPGQTTDSFFIDNNGFRGGFDQANRPLVMVLGGSAAFGYGLERDEQLLTAVLQREMSGHTFVNAAVVGFVSGQESAHMIHHLDRFRPGVYILLDGWNEVAEQFDRDNHLGVNQQFLNFSRRLHQYNLMTDRTGVAGTPYPVEPLDSGEKNDLDGILITYLDNLDRMNAWAGARGARFLVLLQPEVTRRDNPTARERGIGGHPQYSALYRRFTERALEGCRERGVECHDVSLQPEFQESPETLFLDIVHPSAAGHEVLGKIVRRLLEDGG